MHGTPTRALLLLSTLLVPVGCGSEPPSPGTPSRKASAGPAVEIPRHGCVESVRDRGRLWEMAAVAPRDMRTGEAQPQDRGWLPVRLADLAVAPDAYVVLDGGGHRVTRFTRDFSERTGWGRRGRGPGEFEAPRAVAVRGREIWVLDRSRVTVFDPEGRVLRTVPLQGNGVDLAVDPRGRLYVARFVLASMAESAPERFGTVVATFEPDGSPGEPLVRYRDHPGPPRFVLPGPNPVRVKTVGDRVAVFYPAGGVVDVYRDREPVTTVRVCMPEALAGAYAEQRDQAGGPSGRQSSLLLITDVRLGPDGSMSVVGPTKDQEGRYHIDHFGPGGASLGSTVLPADQVGLPEEVRFGPDEMTLVALSAARGIVAEIRVRPRKDER